MGKSSLINSLKRSRSAAAVGNTPGMTKNKEIVLDKHVKLIDSPAWCSRAPWARTRA